jgi:UDP-N-acetylglucosamine--N-acetylmuramyl-(pentapeptide) pyrophosphoryl-undecaprenol N-acetylglucosamine transferase
LVYGGSQGARTINEVVVDAFAKDGPLVLHLAGERDFALLRDRVRRDGYRLLPFTHDFGAALAAADLALARAGGSVYELAAAKTPAVLVPYPHATGDHQAKNARHFADAGAAALVQEADLRGAPALVTSLLADPGRLAQMAAAMGRTARPDAAEEIADEVLALAGV